MPLRDRPGVADVGVAGAQAAISFCTPDGQPDPARAQALQRAMLERQTLVYGGGKSGECLLLVPPLNLAAEPLSRALADLVMLIDAKEHDIPLG
jgi:4-aminobutyrate aminotransferase